MLFPTFNAVFGLTENRATERGTRMSIQDLSSNSIFQYFDDFEYYYSKNFYGRSMFFRSVSYLKYNFFGTSIKPEPCLVGEDDFLFLGNNASDIIDETLGVEQFNHNELRKINSRIISHSEWMKENSIDFIFAVAPNKHSVYPEKLPFEVEEYTQRKINQIYRLISQNSNISWVNLIDGMQGNSRYGSLYHKTDSHWNSVGGYLGYRNIITKLNEIYPGDFLSIRFEKLDKYSIERNTYGLSRMLDLPIYEMSNDVKIQNPKAIQQPGKIEHNKRNDFELRFVNPRRKFKILIFRDSFGTELVPYLSEHFKESIFIWSSRIDRELIIKEKPDLVLFEIVERNLDVLLNF